ncbi:hypothetical protein BGZ50_006709 [Haplosporangium sp. Z 11]|nr:hypothetical protein BGZ50_006709 [Haplosporangium sp. Z 11]
MAHVPAGTLPWSTTADFDAKDLFDPLAEALCLDPMVINPAQLCAPPRVHVLDGGDVDGRSNNGMYMYSHGRGYDDNDSVDGTDDDVDARRHLSDSSYLSSTPPLSPNILDHHQHSHLVQTLAGLSTSSPLRGSVSSFAHAFELFSNGPSAAHQRSDSQDRCQDDEDEHDEIYEEDNEEKYQQQQQNQQKDQEEAEERQFECQQCHKRFLRQYNLNAHLKTHSSERLHNCNQCDKSFLRPYDLSRHQRIHSKDKPYSCVICGLIFIRNDAIWRHYRKLHQNHPDVPISRRDKSKQKSASTTVPSKPRASAN